MRTLSTNFLRGAFAQETGICPIFLLTITHKALTDPIRISSDPTQRLSETVEDIIYGTQSRGNDFIFFPFSLTLPSDEDNGAQSIKLTLDNVTRKYTEIIRSISGPPSVTTDIVLSETPDVVEASWPQFLLTDIEFDASVITGTLTLETLYQEPYPAGTFCPSYFPGLF